MLPAPGAWVTEAKDAVQVRLCVNCQDGAAGTNSVRPGPRGNSSQSVRAIFNAIRNLCVTKCVTHDARKKCLLLHVAGEYVFDVADALTEGELTYATMKDKLNEHLPEEKRRIRNIYVPPSSTREWRIHR